MDVIRRAHSMRELMRRERRHGRKVGFVPTMGALHEGHLSLVRRMRAAADTVVVSIFVNPAQFDEGEDLARYPRDLTGDVDRLQNERIDYVFAPETGEIYPDGDRTWVEVSELGELFEGKERPGHFRGVTTVVMKLLQIVHPTIVAFGQKDFQQAVIVKRMVRDLMVDVEVEVLPTVREDDGLALSSRNRFLSTSLRQAALAVPQALDVAKERFEAGERRPEELIVAVREALEASDGLAVDYVDLVDVESLTPVPEIERDAVLLVAVRAGNTRLLDNLVFKEPAP